MPDVGDYVDITQVVGLCVYCEKVIFLKGQAAVGVRSSVLKHIHDCSQHPLHGYKTKKFESMRTKENHNAK